MAHDASSTAVICYVELPTPSHSLYCWKVRNGSSVRVGETVALVKRKASASAPATAIAVKKHKRPTRRKKPAAEALKSVASTSDEPSKTTITTPTANEDNTKSSTTEKSKAEEEAPSSSSFSAPSSTTAKPQTGNPASSSSSLTTTKPMASKPQMVSITSQGDGILRMGKPPRLEKDAPNTDLIIGYIQKCSHPTVVDGLCAVCGEAVPVKGEASSAPASNNQHNNSNNNSNTSAKESSMSRVTVGGLTVAISDLEGQRMAEQDAERLRKQRKLSLVLDLDHTLVHATNDTRGRQYLHREDVRTLVLPVPGPHQLMWMQHFVKLRPNVKEFLELAHSLYEVGVYTAGTRDYAEQITVMLSRHLVGAQRDQVDLDQLRHQLRHAQQELARLEAKNGNDKGENAATGKGEAESSSTDGSRKRKRVTFGEPTSEEKTDHTTPEKVAELQAELEEAERLESKAQEMRQKLFGSRVVSRTDVGDLGRDVKSLKRIFPCGGVMAVVVDDREDVWANAGESRPGEPPENLLLVRPYHWDKFTGFADVNNAAGVDLTTSTTTTASKSKPKGENDSSQMPDKDKTDQQLQWTGEILQRLHAKFYASSESSTNHKTVPDVLRKMRQQVLSGVRYVESLGGTVLSSVGSTTTHVVAAKDGTDKTIEARKLPSCYVVKVSWLMECFWSMTHREEPKHLLGAGPRTLPIQPLGSSRVENASSSSDDDDDEDLAAELENEMMETA